MKYLLPYFLAGLLIVGMAFGGYALWIGPAVLFVLHPALDRWIGKGPDDSSNNASQESALAESALVLYPAFQTAILIWMLFRLATQQELQHPGAWVPIALSLGILTGGLGITVAHELIHRRRKWQRGLGTFLLMQVSYTHFRVEHVFGHHRWVATPEDPATARRGEWLPMFWIRSISGSLTSAYRLDRRRFARGWALTLVMASAIAAIAGPIGLAFFAVQSLTAVLLLETINYVEHYGLVRAKFQSGAYEPVKPCHSWDTSYNLTNWTLFNLGKHAHHHASPMVAYSKLRQRPAAPQLPYGYSLMLMAALIPPLFFRLMNPALERVSGS